MEQRIVSHETFDQEPGTALALFVIPANQPRLEMGKLFHVKHSLFSPVLLGVPLGSLAPSSFGRPWVNQPERKPRLFHMKHSAKPCDLAARPLSQGPTCLARQASHWGRSPAPGALEMGIGGSGWSFSPSGSEDNKKPHSRWLKCGFWPMFLSKETDSFGP